MMTKVLIYALLANLTFSIGSFYFALFARKIDSLWVNTFKSLVGFLCLFVGVFLVQKGHFEITSNGFYILFISGLVGLCVGDFFMVDAMRILGGSRVVMMFGLTPFFTGIFSYYVFGSTLALNSIIGVCLMVLCLFLLSLEKYKSTGHWELKGIFYGVLAVFLDNLGLVLTKSVFNSLEHLNSLEANFFRTIGALVGFGLIHIFIKKIPIYKTFFSLNKNEKLTLFISSAFGMFVSLYFYLKAVSFGHLSVVSSMSGTGPLFTEIFDCVKSKKRPHPLWLLAFLCFLSAIYFFIS